VYNEHGSLCPLPAGPTARGLLSCDDFGDCGAGRVSISRYTDPSVKDIAELPIVYRYKP